MLRETWDLNNKEYIGYAKKAGEQPDPIQMKVHLNKGNYLKQNAEEIVEEVSTLWILL